MDENTFAYCILDKLTRTSEESQFKVKGFKLSPSGERGKVLDGTRCGSLRMRRPHLLALVMTMLLIWVYLYTLLNVVISLQMLLIIKMLEMPNTFQKQ